MIMLMFLSLCYKLAFKAVQVVLMLIHLQRFFIGYRINCFTDDGCFEWNAEYMFWYSDFSQNKVAG